MKFILLSSFFLLKNLEFIDICNFEVHKYEMQFQMHKRPTAQQYSFLPMKMGKLF